MCLPSSTAATTNAKASSLDGQIAYTKQQVKHDKQVLKRYNKRLHRHQRKLKELQGIKKLYSLSPVEAILTVFKEDPQGALNVASCESGFDINAKNGQYLGIFQMGSSERSRYASIGYSTAYQQIVAAHNYYSAHRPDGSQYEWGPWECSPY
jgi:hypothetical protein